MISDCPFCTLEPTRTIHLALTSVIALRDGFPVTEGHTLIIPNRHIATWFDATPAERMELWSAIDLVCSELDKQYQPQGYNFGINSGEAAGQTVPHLHLHVIPRYEGDMEDPRGGVRHVIPEKGNYKPPTYNKDTAQNISEGTQPSYNIKEQNERTLFTSGPSDPLLPALKQDISKSTQVDIAVAFVFKKGLDKLKPHLDELLQKGGKFRMLTGDYLNSTDPDALADLLDMKANHPDTVEVYIHSGTHRSFHPKSYLMFDYKGEHAAYVGSSNMSHSALVEGIEWNYRISSDIDKPGWLRVAEEFNNLLKSPYVKPLDHQWITEYRSRRKTPTFPTPQEAAVEPAEELPPATPNIIQAEALEALEKTRADGNRAGLVVMATGTGKTWLAAFDVASDTTEFKRVLFVAHREEILKQSLSTFRRINPLASMGLYNATEKEVNTDMLFASIQTINRDAHLRRFNPQDFDYIVIDEFHHAAANTYRRLIDYFTPKFMLGLTATPERTDGGDLLALCDENLVYRCDVPRGIKLELLSAYHYFGVPDTIDYKNIPWRSRKFDEAALTQAAETDARAQNIYEQWLEHGKTRTMAFCVSKSHANFMRHWFRAKGVKCVAVHSGADSDPRSLSMEQLEQGDIQIVFAIDMFNEGVDIPELDTVMMLRPTESAIVWLQQFGRGLRKSGDKILTVIDYIGNHRSFLLKLRTLLNLQSGGDGAIQRALKSIQDGTLPLPAGCEVTYDLEAIDILQALLRKSSSEESALTQYYKDFREQHGQRPTAAETYHDGYLPNTAKSSYGSWLEMVKSMGDLSPDETQVLDDHSVFIKGLETTSMSKSYKMVLLRAMLNSDALPGEGALIDKLTESVSYLIERSQRVAEDFGTTAKNKKSLKSSLVKNPIAAWTDAKALKGEILFSFAEDYFRYVPEVDNNLRPVFQTLVREIVEWRLAFYLDRQPPVLKSDDILMKVSHTNNKPILFLPDRANNTGIPTGWQRVEVGDRKLFFNFVKVAVNVVAEEENSTNILPQLLREWFGPDAGLPGTNFQVKCEHTNDGFIVTPLTHEQDTTLSAFKRYSREQIPQFFNETFNPGKWNAGHITAPTKDPKHIILLVTLEKQDMQDDHQYTDTFLSATEFQWQSQNSTSQSGNKGQQLVNHVALGLTVHLFVRKTKKIAGNAAPFTYCGELEFVSWNGDKPITVQWRLKSALPDGLKNNLLE